MNTPLLSILISSLLGFGFLPAAGADLRGDESPSLAAVLSSLQHGRVPDPSGVSFRVNVIGPSGSFATSVPRGAVISAVVYHPRAPGGESASAVLIHPVTRSDVYRETMLHRRVMPHGTTATQFVFAIPAWNWIEGQAYVVVQIPGRGYGIATFQVT